ncbi:MAG: 8-amino-7-oxononanoate synthase [Candidatus Omnitrophica bacterium]|nr:8-amino-7-oxononanoate synthase [Candidatus Omnitrophota bacterium]
MEWIDEFLAVKKEKSLLRVLKPAHSKNRGLISFNNKEYIDFSSNDYLGLSGHLKLKDVLKKTTDIYGTSVCSSRLLSGDLELHHILEKKIAEFKHKDSALIFNSGYQANLGIISSICKKGDVIFSDRLNHASIIDGILLSGVKYFRYQHNDINNLEYLLKKERNKYKNGFIITESVFSMDGDSPKLDQIVRFKENYDCVLMVDEAHATGIFGENGAGLAEEQGVSGSIDLIMGTFGKALGGFGAYLACSKNVKQYLVNACRSFIYSTALPAHVIAVNLASLDLIKQEPYRREELLANADFFREILKNNGYQVKGSSQIVPLMVKDAEKAVSLSEELQSKGYWVLPIRPPTVPQGGSRLRFSITYYHKKEILENLFKDINKVRNKYGL